VLEQEPDSAVKPALAGMAQARIRAAFSEIIKRLKTKGLISLHGLYIWPSTPTGRE
jgi:hypothetical protein